MATNEEMSSMDEALKQCIKIQEELPKEEFFKKITGAKARVQEYGSSKPKIQKVPHILRKYDRGDQLSTFEKYYEPRAVALGPFHHGKESCQLAEMFKLALTEKFIEDSGCTAEDLHKIIEDNINTLRDCYVEEATRSYTDEVLTQLLFLDGCSTLQFISSFQKIELGTFKIKMDQIAFAQQDLFLLENQLPYQVLQMLMNKSNKKEELNTAIQDFVRGNIMAPTKEESNTTKWKKHTKVCRNNKEGHLINVNDLEPREPTHLLDLLRKEMLGPIPIQGENCSYEQQSFRNIQELKAAGIRIKPSKKNTLKEITFKSIGFVKTLQLPPISVDDSMRPKFLNLIAYEMCPDFQNDFGVSSYICFLDSLIDHADDVKELRSAKVLHNLLGSDREVAQLFNEIGTDLVLNKNLYCKVKEDIDKHCKSKAKTWMAQFCHQHFDSPWTILAFLGVLVALGLSVIQTWYAVHPPSSPCDAVCDNLKKQLNI